MKYMRIQGREDSYITKYPKGVFALCWNLIRDGFLSEEEKELFISIDDWQVAVRVEDGKMV